jgi:hypothetical protein
MCTADVAIQNARCTALERPTARLTVPHPRLSLYFYTVALARSRLLDDRTIASTTTERFDARRSTLDVSRRRYPTRC